MKCFEQTQEQLEKESKISEQTIKKSAKQLMKIKNKNLVQLFQSLKNLKNLQKNILWTWIIGKFTTKNKFMRNTSNRRTLCLQINSKQYYC